MTVEKEATFEIQKRRLLVIWVYHLKPIKSLNRFGTMVYVSRKRNYVLMYLNEESFEEVEQKVKRLHFVRRVERSYRPDVEMNFSDRVGTKALSELSEEVSEKN